jgi:hypothetical protein
MFHGMNRALIALAMPALFACSNGDDIPVFCEDSRSTVVMLRVSESDAEGVDAVTVTGSGCRQEDVTCHANWEDGSCRTYHVGVSLTDDASQGICQISVTYATGRTPDDLEVPVSMSECGPVTGVDDEFEFDLPLGSGAAGGGGAGGGGAGGGHPDAADTAGSRG